MGKLVAELELHGLDERENLRPQFLNAGVPNSDLAAIGSFVLLAHESTTFADLQHGRTVFVDMPLHGVQGQSILGTVLHQLHVLRDTMHIRLNFRFERLQIDDGILLGLVSSLGADNSLGLQVSIELLVIQLFERLADFSHVVARFEHRIQGLLTQFTL